MNIKTICSKLCLVCAMLTLAGCSGSDEGAQTSNDENQAVASVPEPVASTSSESNLDEEEQLIERAMQIHESVITLDTHNDFSNDNFTEELNYTMNIKSQVNLPKMRDGGLDVSWLIVFTGQGELNEEGYVAATHRRSKLRADLKPETEYRHFGQALWSLSGQAD